MEFIFLGTSSGTPTRQRNVSGLAIRKEHQKSWCLVDCGEGTQHQLLKTPLSINHLQVIFITHIHGDHCYGLPGLLASAGMSGRKKALTIVAPREIKHMITVVMACSDMHLSFELEFVDVEQYKSQKLPCDFDVDVITLSHRVPCYAYVFSYQAVSRKLNVEKLRKDGIPEGPVWGRIQKGEDINTDGGVIVSQDYLLPMERAQKIIVGGDNDRPDLLLSYAHDADVIIHESTYTEEVALKVGPGPQHSSAKTIAQCAQKAEVAHLVLTHFSARYQNNDGKTPHISEIRNEAQEYYDGQLFLASDFDVYVLDSKGILTCVDNLIEAK